MIQFRQKALAKLQAPSELDAPVKLAQPHSVVALVVAALLVAAGTVWACTGSLSRSTDAPGILTHAAGSFTLQSPVSGQITGVFVEQGATFPVHTPMFTVQVGSRQEVIRSITGGRATAVLGKVGQVITQGAQLAVIERSEGAADPLVAVLYVTQDKAGLIHKDDHVDLSVQSAPAPEFGVLRGTVQSIEAFPASTQQISDFLGDTELGRRFSAHGQPVKVVVRLSTGRTTSGFQWSTRQGPPYQIDSRTLVTAAFHLAPLKPIKWVVS
ncbi:HlyD family efflux transporter periplasmic adaptor subunit [Streptomyces sp. NPDC006539]|uniref:HlyD family efflux transporter periplasmic adaptor subunit n=1 Tax=Streptomyces sp. NPDC006539 TaxID=3155352 RepID=UPI0033BABA3C